MSHLSGTDAASRSNFSIFRWWIPALMILSQVSVALTAFAGTDTNREIAQVRARWHFSQGEFSQGIQVLKEHLAEDAEDISALQLVGLVLMQDGKFRDAASFFKRATLLGSVESRLIAFYNLADAYARAGAVTESVATLKFAVQGGIPGGELTDERRDQFLSVSQSVQAGVPLPPYGTPVASSWVLSAAVSGGYDSNVILASEATVAAAEATNAASVLYSPSLQWAWRKPIGNQGKSLFLGAVANYTGYTQVDAMPYSSLGLSQITDWRVTARGSGSNIGGSTGAHWFLSVGNQVDVVLLNTTGLGFFSAIETLRPRLTRSHSAQSSTELELGLRWQSFVQPSSPSLDRSGPGLRPRLVHRTRLGPTLFAVGAGADVQFASGAEYRSVGVSLPVSLVVPRLWRQLGLVSAWEPTLTQYSQSSTGRVDRLIQGSVGLRLPLWSRSLVGLDLGLRSNQSNLADATFSKFSASLSFTQDLL